MAWSIGRIGHTAGGNNRERNATLTFQVIADNDNETPLTARFATSSGMSVPRFGETHPDDPTLFCLNTTADFRTLDSRRIFDIQANYTSNLGAYGGTNPEENPLLQAPTWRITFQDFVEPYLTDADGLVIQNTAGMMYDPSPVREVSRPILEISKNVAAVNVGELMYYTNSVNSDAWNGWLPGEARLKITGGVQQTSPSGVQYVNVTYQIMFRERQAVRSIHNANTILSYAEGWDDAIVSQGFWERRRMTGGVELDPTATAGAWELFRIRAPETPGGTGGSDPAADYSDASAPPTGENWATEPEPLDQYGQLLKRPGTTWDDTENAAKEPYFILVRPYKRLAFGPLRLL